MRNEIFIEFDQMLTRSGYQEEVRMRIFECGLKGYENLRELDRRGIRKLHRRGVDTITERR